MTCSFPGTVNRSIDCKNTDETLECGRVPRHANDIHGLARHWLDGNLNRRRKLIAYRWPESHELAVDEAEGHTSVHVARECVCPRGRFPICLVH